MARNAYKNHVADQGVVAFSTSEQAQTTITVPSYGADIASVEIELTLAVTGTPSSPGTLSDSISNIYIETKDGKGVLNAINGNDWVDLCRVRNKGRTVTDPAVADAATATFDVPLNIEKKDQEVKFQLSVNTLASLATSGISAATLTYKVIFWYYNDTASTFTEKINKISKTVAAADNSFGTDITKDIDIYNIFFRVTTESYYSKIRFTADGTKELDAVDLKQLKGKEEANSISGHVTGFFILPVAPFHSSSATAFDVTATTADSMDIFLISRLA